MIRNLLWPSCLILCGCTSMPEHVDVNDTQPSTGAPLGLAWIPANGDVAINSAAVEHVLFPRTNSPRSETAPRTSDGAHSAPVHNDTSEPSTPKFDSRIGRTDVPDAPIVSSGRRRVPSYAVDSAENGREPAARPDRSCPVE
ncbi:MAG TPA: hypothetical protein VK025_07830 [Steroidobacter sp.]|nr:hypothetical protein [Steroidobacteraceae bacterium]HLS81298.1 hypothetical protein [Steroidobacter sp.]